MTVKLVTMAPAVDRLLTILDHELSQDGLRALDEHRLHRLASELSWWSGWADAEINRRADDPPADLD